MSGRRRLTIAAVIGAVIAVCLVAPALANTPGPAYLAARAARARPAALGYLPVALGLPLLITIVVEVAVAAALGLRSRRELTAVGLVSVVTNPVLNLGIIFATPFLMFGTLLLPRLEALAARTHGVSRLLVPLLRVLESSKGYVLALLLAEVVIVFVEWGLLVWALGGLKRRLFAVSAVMNGVSFLAGVALWPVLAQVADHFQRAYFRI